MDAFSSLPTPSGAAARHAMHSPLHLPSQRLSVFYNPVMYTVSGTHAPLSTTPRVPSHTCRSACWVCVTHRTTSTTCRCS